MTIRNKRRLGENLVKLYSKAQKRGLQINEGKTMYVEVPTNMSNMSNNSSNLTVVENYTLILEYINSLEIIRIGTYCLQITQITKLGTYTMIVIVPCYNLYTKLFKSRILNKQSLLQVLLNQYSHLVINNA